jgi:two-component system, LuxR family, sensor kinase FixL
MKHQLPSPVSSSFLALIAAGAIAIGVFTLDTFTPLEVASAVLYVVAVILVANFFQRRGVLLVAAGCIALTVFSYLLQHGPSVDAHLGRGLMSIAAIVIATALVLRNQTANLMLRERARLLDLTHDTVFVRDMKDCITYWNRGAQELYGWNSEQAIGKVTHDLLKTVFPAPIEELSDELLRTGRWEGELVHTKRDGTPVTVASRWSLQRDKRERPIAVLETNNDVTERNRAQEDLHQAQAELAHVTRAMTLGELTASIAHEVNQPLAAIVTNGQAGLRWLNRDEPQLDEVRGAMEHMISDGMRASEVITRIRALMRKTDPQMVALNLNDIIHDVMTLVQREMLDHRVMLRLELAPVLPPVLADRVQVQQVMINLVINGIQAMEPVTNRPRELRIRSEHDTDKVSVEVLDSGVGIPDGHADRLFNPFFTTKSNGMGMGLSICHSIIQAHGGQISAANNAEWGALFQFTLPVHQKSAQPGLATARDPEIKIGS